MTNMLRIENGILLALALTLLTTGCLTNDTIRLRTADSIMPATRVSWQATQPTSRRVAFSGLTVDGEVAYTTGNDNQPIGAGRQVTLRRSTFSGPTTLRTRAKIIDFTGNLRGGLLVNENFRLEPLLGVEVTDVNLEIAAGGVQQSDESTNIGMMAGVRMGYQPHHLIEFYTQYSVGALDFGRGSDNNLRTSKLEIGGRLMPFDHLGFFAAYRRAHYDQPRSADESDARMRFFGPVFGLETRF